jgi:4-alpha-glucanotransferase
MTGREEPATQGTASRAGGECHLMDKRGSGILLHISSLPSRFGIGDLGPGAYRFADFLRAAVQRYWQILPLNPTDLQYDNSPYHSISAFAHNPLLISPDLLIRDGLLDQSDCRDLPDCPPRHVDFEEVAQSKEHILRRAFDRFEKTAFPAGYASFCSANAWWLDDFALFSALKLHFGGSPWFEWPDELKQRDTAALQDAQAELADGIEEAKFLQYIFMRQWRALRLYCNSIGIRIIGDIPIYVDHDSVDVWVNPRLFQLDDQGMPVVIAGVPPDYFSATGQLWNNPLYRWEEHKKSGFDWWVRRMARNLECVDYLRIDHFRGLVAYWEVPAGSDTAINGRWVPAPADEFLTTLQEQFPCLPIIAEDLGIITPDVREVMQRYVIPGMKVLEFAFEEGYETNPYIPHNVVRNCILYTGTHDNNPVRGWIEEDATEDHKKRLWHYLGYEVRAADLPWTFIRLAMMTVADTVIIPMQDILGLGSEARMNRPGINKGNWRWRLSADEITPDITGRLKGMTGIYARR